VRFFIFLTLMLFGTASSADILRDKDAVKQLVAKVMKSIGEGKTEEGLRFTKPYLIIPTSEFNVVLEKLKLQAPVIEQRFGKTIGVEKYKVEEAGESLMLVMYLQKYEKHLMRWKFYFYKTKEGWVLNTFDTDDNIRLMFKNG